MRGYNEVKVQASVAWPDSRVMLRTVDLFTGNGKVVNKGDDHSLNLFDSTFLTKSSVVAISIEIENEQIIFKLLFLILSNHVIFLLC